MYNNNNNNILYEYNKIPSYRYELVQTLLLLYEH